MKVVMILTSKTVMIMVYILDVAVSRGAVGKMLMKEVTTLQTYALRVCSLGSSSLNNEMYFFASSMLSTSWRCWWLRPPHSTFVSSTKLPS